MTEWALAKKETIGDQKVEMPYGFFGSDQSAAFSARHYLEGSYVVQRS